MRPATVQCLTSWQSVAITRVKSSDMQILLMHMVTKWTTWLRRSASRLLRKLMPTAVLGEVKLMIQAHVVILVTALVMIADLVVALVMTVVMCLVIAMMMIMTMLAAIPVVIAQGSAHQGAVVAMIVAEEAGQKTAALVQVVLDADRKYWKKQWAHAA